MTLREASRADVASKPSEVTLVDALLAARILIARTDADGRPTVRLAHDAVLASWPRASEAAQAGREFYRVRAEVEDALRRWQEHGLPKDRLIQSGVPLAEAEKLVGDFGAELPVELTSFVTASRHRARRRQRFERAAAVFFFALAAAATGATVWAYFERDRSVQAFATIVQTGNTLVYDLGTNFFVLGLPTDLLERMLDQAIQSYNQAIQRDPKNAVAYVSRGLAYAIKGDHERAIQDYDKAIQLKDSIACTLRGLLYHRQVAHLRVGRIFVAGDAAHIHSPFGGQGMNTGLHDIWNGSARYVYTHGVASRPVPARLRAETFRARHCIWR